MRLTAMFGVFAFGACASSSTAPVTVTPAAAPVIAEAPVEPVAPVRCSIEGEFTNEDLDGDGELEHIQWNDSELCVAGQTIAHGVGSPYELEPRVIDIDPEVLGRELVLVDPGIEDDATYYLFVWDGELRSAGEVFVGNEAEIVGDGTLVTHNGNCGQSTVVVWRLVGGRMERASEETTGTYADDLCSACPFVYIERHGQRHLAGEILRNLKGHGAETLQALPIARPDVHAGVVRVRVSEEKPETTYLDHIYLDVNGVSVAPAGCENGGAWCAADGDYHVIEQGGAREFSFEVGELPAGARVTVQARGYYVPHRRL